MVKEKNTSKIADFFKFRERNTSYKRELIAGIIMFMTMAYVPVIQPRAIVGYGDAAFIIDASGVMIAKGAIVVTCVIISGLITLLMVLCANLPFALATDMESNLIFGALIQSQQLSFGGAMVMTLISGAIFLLLTVFDIRDLIAKVIPKNIKISIGAIIGSFITYLGFRNTGTVAFTESGVGMRNFTDPAVMLAVLGLIIIVILTAYKANDATLIGIAIVTLLEVPAGATIVSSTFAKVPGFTGLGNAMFNLDFKSIFNFSPATLIFTAFCGDFFSTLGTILGVSAKAGMLDENGDLPNIWQPSLVNTIGTRVGVFTGNTIITISMESSTGVEAGGRTGFASAVVFVIFTIIVFLSPLVLMIPNAVTGPALVFVGFLMISGPRDTDLAGFTESFEPSVMTISIVPTGSITSGISAGILVFIFIKTATGKFRGVHPVMYVMATSLVCYFIYGQSKRCMRVYLFKRGSVVYEAAAEG